MEKRELNVVVRRVEGLVLPYQELGAEVKRG
jgi:hypothetical protein